MENPETLTTLGTLDIGRRQTKKKQKKERNFTTKEMNFPIVNIPFHVATFQKHLHT